LPSVKSRCLSEMSLGVAGTDVSDGLGTDLCQMCSASGVGAIVDGRNRSPAMLKLLYDLDL